MHELGIVSHLITSVEEVAKENNLSLVSVVTLEIGEVSGVIGSYLEDCWKWSVTKSELLKDSQLKIEVIAAFTACEECGNTYPTVEFGKTCPACGSQNTHLVAGNEINLKEIEAC